MEISKGIQIIDLALWLESEKTLILSDFHLGYEENLQKQGILLPKFQIKEIINKIKEIFKIVKPKTIIINGDLKHGFGRNSEQEWKDSFTLINFLKENCKKLVFIKGNHDNYLQSIASKKEIKVVDDFLIKDILITHGNKLVKTKAKRIIIGHEHPAIIFKDKGKVEKFKCFLQGKWERKELIVMPSFNPLLEGTDIIKEKLLSPFLTNISNFEVYVIGEKEVFKFGKVKELRQ